MLRLTLTADKHILHNSYSFYSKVFKINENPKDCYMVLLVQTNRISRMCKSSFKAKQDNCK